MRQAALFGCGVASVFAWRAELPATGLLLLMAAGWIGATLALARTQGVPLPAAPIRPGEGGAEARLLASLLDQTPAPLVVRRTDGRLFARNRAARRLFRTEGLLIDPPAVLACAMAGQSEGRAVVTLGEGEGARPFALSLSDMVAEDGAQRLAILLDVAPEVRAAEAGALRELMQVLSHEIMNGLTPVASLAATARDLLAEGGEAAHAQAVEAVEVLARRAEGVARFAEGYRTLARLPPPLLAPVDVQDLMGEAAQLFRSRWGPRGVVLSVRDGSARLRVRLDRDQVMQALLNLLANAAEAALEGEDEPTVALDAQPMAERGLVLLVSDNGRGVPQAVRAHFGQPFLTTKTGGAGIGVSLARQVARAHGGDLVLAPPGPRPGAEIHLTLMPV